MSHSRECKHGGAPERLSWTQDRGREVRMIDRIRIMLCFQAKPSVIGIENTTDTRHFAVEMITRVKLHSGLGCAHLHHPAAFRLRDSRGQQERFAISL